MAENKFYQFDTGKQNMMPTYDYSIHSQRLAGVGTGQAISALHNKLFYQVSTITSALAQVMVNNGYDMGSSIESSWVNTVTQLSNIVTKAFLSANYYTIGQTQTYVAGLLSAYATIAYVDAAIAQIQAGSGSSVTYNDAKNILAAAFGISGSQTLIGGAQFPSYRASKTEIQEATDESKYISPKALKDSKYVPMLFPGSISEEKVIVSQSGEWVTKDSTYLTGLAMAAVGAAGYLTRGNFLEKLITRGGYIKIPTSDPSKTLIIQWGYFYISGKDEASGTYTYTSNEGIAFPNGALNVILGSTRGHINGAGYQGIYVSAISKIDFTWYSAWDKSENTDPVRFLAIGY